MYSQSLDKYKASVHRKTVPYVTLPTILWESVVAIMPIAMATIPESTAHVFQLDIYVNNLARKKGKADYDIGGSGKTSSAMVWATLWRALLAARPTRIDHRLVPFGQQIFVRNLSSQSFLCFMSFKRMHENKNRSHKNDYLAQQAEPPFPSGNVCVNR